MAFLTFLMQSRSGSRNPYACIKSMIASVEGSVSDPSNVEILIKFDDDDPELDAQLAATEGSNLTVKTLVSPRAEGFFAGHKTYNDLLLMADDNSWAVWVVSDDARMTSRGIDVYIRETFDPKGAWIVHSPSMREKFPKLNWEWLLRVADPYPMWSRTLLEACGGFPSVASTDAWTGLLGQTMIERYGINIRHFWPGNAIHRMIAEDDMMHYDEDADMTQAQRNRTEGVHKLHKTMSSNAFKRQLYWNAHCLYLYLGTAEQFGFPSDEDFILHSRK